MKIRQMTAVCLFQVLIYFIFSIPGIRSEAAEASEAEEFDDFGFKVDDETKLVKLFRFHIFFY